MRAAGPHADWSAPAHPPGTPWLTVDFPAGARRCPQCERPLQTQKSKTRRVSTLTTGTIRAREIRKCCGPCPAAPVAVSAALAALVPPQQRFGYDLIAWVGLARYHRHRQRHEIRADLARQGIQLADGSVSVLCDRFLRALETLHRHHAPGYPLHIDATSDKGRGGLFLCRDGWRGWVLHAVKVSSENAAELQPAIEDTINAFGPPVATMRDLGSAGAKAIAGCQLEAVPDLVCHYHFLAAVGRKLLDVEYAALRGQLRRSKVRSGLRELLRAVRGRAGVRAELAALGRRARIAWSVPRLERRWAVFNELRTILRLRDDELPRGSRPVPPAHRGPAATAAHLQAIETAAKTYHDELRQQVAAQQPCRTDHRPQAVVLAYLDRYIDGLFGHPVARGPDGQVLAVVERTNNVAEHFFATAKEQLRRRLGRRSSGGTWKTSRRRPRWPRTCCARTTCASCAARWTACRRPLPNSTARPSRRRRPCSATTRMPSCASASGLGRPPTSSSFQPTNSSPLAHENVPQQLKSDAGRNDAWDHNGTTINESRRTYPRAIAELYNSYLNAGDRRSAINPSCPRR